MPGYDGFNVAYQAASFPNYGDEAQMWGALAYDLIRQEPMSTRAVASRLEMSYNGAKVLLHKISRVVPIYMGDDQRWRTVDDDPHETWTNATPDSAGDGQARPEATGDQ